MERTAFLFVFCLLWHPSLVLCQEMVDGEVVSQNSIESDDAVNDYIHFYQRFISSQKQGVCAMYPSCSNFGLMVFRDRPFLEAVTLTSDRLIRCSHDQQMYETTYSYGRFSCVDLPYYIPNFRHISSRECMFPKTESTRFCENDTLKFVSSLINSEDYHSAMYQLARSQFDNNGLSTELFAKKLLCLRALNRTEEGIFEYETNQNPLYRQSFSVGLQAFLSYYQTGNDRRALQVLDNIKIEHSDRIGNIYTLRGIANVRLGDYETARHCFDMAQLQLEDTLTYYQNLSALEKMCAFRPKSKSLAEALSVIPGLGYLYAGHCKSALTSLLVNCALGYATYTSIKSQNYGVAGLCGFFTLSFYLGNITGAGRSVERYNNRKKQQIIEMLEEQNNIFLIN